ncbi:MAG: SLC13 family permease [Nitrospirota bacterium]|nr:SLC13 family permease [Nitrospirota bacterium]
MLTMDMILVMGVIVAAVFLFIVEWVRVDVVALIVMVTLPLLGLVSGNEAFMGLSSNAVISIIAVIIIGAGLDGTGIMNKVAKPITRLAGNSESRLITLVSATVAVISSFMQNIGAVALFLPATQRVSKKMNVPPSRILIPMGYLGIIGGCLTLVGSSPLILLNDLLIPNNLEPFGLFDVTPIGIALVIAALLYFVLFGRFILPSRGLATEGAEGDVDFGKIYHAASGLFELKVPDDCRVCSHTLEDMAIRPDYLVTVVAVAKHAEERKIFAPTRTMKLSPGNDIAVVGAKDNVERFAQDFGLKLKDKLETFEDDLSDNNAGMVEVIVTPRSALEGKTLREVHFREKYQVNPIAIRKGQRVFYGGLSDIPLQSGDMMFLQGLWEKFAILKDSKDLSFITPFEAEVMKTHKAKAALFCFAVALVLVVSGSVKLSVALMTGAVGMILTGVLSVDEAYNAVDWRTVFLLGGLIPLGVATEKTGAAAYIATQILSLIGDVSPIVLLTVIGLLTSAFTLVVSNVGATVLLVPLAINMAMGGGVDPRMAALTVAVAASNTFVLPTHQVNAYIMGPGEYKTVDYIKAGSVMTILFLVVMIGTMYVFYGITT